MQPSDRAERIAGDVLHAIGSKWGLYAFGVLFGRLLFDRRFLLAGVLFASLSIGYCRGWRDATDD